MLHCDLQIIINRLNLSLTPEYIHNIIDKDKIVHYGIIGLRDNAGLYYVFFLYDLSKAYINNEWYIINNENDLLIVINKSIELCATTS